MHRNEKAVRVTAGRERARAPGWRSEGTEAGDNAAGEVAAASDSASRAYPEARRQLTRSRVQSRSPSSRVGGFGGPRGCPPGHRLQEGKTNTNKSPDASETGRRAPRGPLALRTRNPAQGSGCRVYTINSKLLDGVS